MIELAPDNAYGLRLSSPVMIAAGCLGYGLDIPRGVDEPLGALVSPTTSLRGRPRRAHIVETASGIVHAGGWPERGLAHVLERCAPAWAAWRTPVLLSISGASPADAAEIAAQLEGVEGIAGVELDLCAASSGERAVAAVRAVRAVTLLPMLAKLPPREDGLVELGLAAAAAGADALVVAGPPRALAIDPRSGERTEGWLCGPAWRPLALRLVALAAAGAGAPVVACGGVASADDARQMIAAGAAAVQVGSALLADPELAVRIATELTR
jgi:dihydroorotate dehydrogenase (NAD+) catalytic subunit